MKIWMKIALCITLSVMCIFVGIGYAEVTSDITIQGTVDVTPPEAVFITNVTQSGTNGSTGTVNGYTMTVLNSKTVLGNSGNSTVTYTITVFNNTDEDYGYNAMIYTVGENTYDNESIVVTPQIERRTVVESQGYLTFDVVVSYKDGEQASDKELNSIITYEFLPLDDIPEDEDEVAVYNVMDKFKQILNTPTDYKTLSDEIAANYDGSRAWTATYIGNVVGTADYENNNDTAIVNDLFDGILTLNINGVDTNVTVIIKRESVDADSTTGDTYYYGDPAVGVSDTEMTLYVTAEDLNAASSGDYVTVYAVVFTIDQDENGDPIGEWYQIGDMYQGKASVVGYIGGYSNGSFDTGTWYQQYTRKSIHNIIQNLE